MLFDIPLPGPTIQECARCALKWGEKVEALEQQADALAQTVNLYTPDYYIVKESLEQAKGLLKATLPHLLPCCDCSPNHCVERREGDPPRVCDEKRVHDDIEKFLKECTE